ncbi:hypothetical protein HHK36_012270 [Tetracentron sinense]|uniref:CP12 domain-containing protein n=1 Tax=Tetracentron sinense TaxID=13715 RepID=A0A834Z900_TETSI|nr:hypothetical protein HHK36_012270 [Tetracentron sinense]
MATTIAGVTLSTTRVVTKADSAKTQALRSPSLNHPWRRVHQFGGGHMYVGTMAATPESISEKVTESIKLAEEACAENPASGECIAAYDEVEELSAAASHARQKMKESDPLETYCSDNPETDECRTYDN